MCLILLALDAHPDFAIVVAANRDEFHARPTAAADFWPDAADLLAGRDLEQGGTWFGVTRGGRIAMLTNHRDPRRQLAQAPSRGGLGTSFLLGDASAPDHLARLRDSAARYNGYNLVAGHWREGLSWFGSRSFRLERIAPGIHGLSNADLDTAWPKVERGRARLEEALRENPPGLEERLLALLDDRTVAADAYLPDTGVPLELERRLSAPFIVGREYGTRSSTVLLVERSGRARFVERSYGRDGEIAGQRSFLLQFDDRAML